MTQMKPKEFEQLRRRDMHCLHCGRDDDTLIPHHRANRGMGGSKASERPSNVILMCADHNGAMESNAIAALEARENGWKLSKSADPMKLPVWDAYNQSWYYLDDSYNRSVILRQPVGLTASGNRDAPMAGALQHSNGDAG